MNIYIFLSFFITVQKKNSRELQPHSTRTQSHVRSVRAVNNYHGSKRPSRATVLSPNQSAPHHPTKSSDLTWKGTPPPCVRAGSIRLRPTPKIVIRPRGHQLYQCMQGISFALTFIQLQTMKRFSGHINRVWSGVYVLPKESLKTP